MKYIENLREGDRISGIYLCKTRQSALTKAGKPYENLIFQDKTGTVDGKIWDPNSGGIDDFDSLDYVVCSRCNHVQGTATAECEAGEKGQRRRV